jgi:arsenate reductase (thioredoxin)
MVPPRGVRGNRPRMRDTGARPAAAPPQPRPVAGKKRVLFLCIGNSCRSQMAEAFARAYGSDVLAAQSAGLSPAMIIAPLTKQVLTEKNVGTEGQFPKSLEMLSREGFDLVVNMSGVPVQIAGVPTIEWPVRDPIGQSEAVYREVATQIESLVMRLILDLRG